MHAQGLRDGVEIRFPDRADKQEAVFGRLDLGFREKGLRV